MYPDEDSEAERSQLRATIFECVNEEEVRESIGSDGNRRDFLAGGEKKLSSRRIRLESGDDLRSQTADRIYDLRCRIVHAKSAESSEYGLLLPFSREAELLGFDIELLEFLARKTLINGASAKARWGALADGPKSPE